MASPEENMETSLVGADQARVPACVAVVGAGTMGAGIAQLAVQAGARTLLHDPIADALAAGTEKIGSMLARLAEKGKISAEEAEAAVARLEPVDAIDGLAPAEIVIEAAPERLELKVELLAKLAEIVGPECVIATNTSSLSVTELAATTPGPERVVGMHFFNPAPVMRLVEVVAGMASADGALATARALGEAMGKRVIDAADVAGFLVNRCNRPYLLESLKLAEERIADVETIDRIERTVGGFRMGSFELMDLVGIETNHAVAEMLHRQSYGEPRYRPSPLQARKIAAGELGRKTGRGWYDYAGGGEYRPADPEPPRAGGGDGRSLLIRGSLPAANLLRSMAADAGWDVSSDADGDPWLAIDFGEHTRAGGPRLRHLHDGSLHALDPEAAGFHLVPPLEGATAIEITSTERSDPEALSRTEELVRTLGRVPEPVGDAPGLVLGRVVCQLINEAAFLVGEGHGTADDVDAGLELGVNHPRGPIRWSRELGLEHVVSVLDSLRRELGEERYRVAPLLRRRIALDADLS
ncbi:MAG TPA: 3-hydroxyacyl-CoA dehydrogenase NAD-binding domain-containing protein [Solirubrobacterales bacterium]|nr:3-hydroxyacyl-CoA dehydrogenase NAD-binding domain-containing protein [Solirubrobacterales bacterium]